MTTAFSVLALAGGCGDPAPSQAPADLASFVVVQDFSKVFVCVTSCTTNTECQDSCPPPASGTSCCDTMTHQCFTSQSAMCPAPPDLAVASPY